MHECLCQIFSCLSVTASNPCGGADVHVQDAISAIDLAVKMLKKEKEH